MIKSLEGGTLLLDLVMISFVDIMGLVHKMIITITVFASTILEPLDRSVQVFEDLTASSTIFFKDARWFLPTFGWKMVALKLPSFVFW